jgi:hypothetical protein
MAKIKGDFWKSDWFLGLIVVLIFFFAGIVQACQPEYRRNRH